MTAENITARFQQVRRRIEDARRRRGPGPEIRLVAVSKKQPVQAIVAALSAGVRDLGENYAQELQRKQQALASTPMAGETRWHFIGALQSNKAKLVVGSHLIHTVDRPSLLQALDRRAEAAGITQEVLVQVNIAREPQKAGAAPERVGELLERFSDHPHVHCRGLMIIPPIGPPEVTRPHFRALRKLRDDLARQRLAGVELQELSMGMSGDFEAAIEEGATLIRVGTAIFGPRPGA